MEKHTVEEAFEKYMEEVNVGAPVQSICGKWIRILGGRLLAGVSRVEINTWGQERVVKAAISTVNRELAVLSKVMTLASRDWGWIDSNPVAGVKRMKGSVSRDRWLSQAEEDALLLASPNWLANVIVFALQTGMRRGEILALTWDRVLLDEGYILIDKSKNGDKRGIPISEKLRGLLATLLMHSGAGHVLTGPTGKIISNNELEYAFRLAVMNAHVGDLHFHDLRHTFATRLVQRGADLYQIQRLLGHRNPAMTQRYAHHSMESLRTAVKLL